MTEPAASAVALSCRGLALGYGGRRVLEGVSLDVAACWTAVIGPNGAGKSTLLRALAGLSKPLAGEVLLDGRNLADWPRRARARRIAWLAQGAGPTDLTAAEVVALGRFAHRGWLAHRPPAEAAAVQAAMAATGTGDLEARRVSTLSGGERQRVYLARALAAGAGVMVLDEPTAQLDPPHQQDVARVLRAAAARGATVVSAIHDLTLALTADRVIVVGHGRVIGHGSVRETLRGGWLTAAFDTPLDIVEHDGAHLWRPAVAAR